MSNQPSQLPATTGQPQGQAPVLLQPDKGEISYTPFGSDDRLKLSLVIIRKFVAVPYTTQQNGQQVELLPDDRECTRFMMLCRSRRLNPFEGDAYMIPFWNKRTNKAEWSLITGIEAFRKRAEVHPEFDGIQSGVIVQTDEEAVLEREGDFQFPGDKLLGAWAKVHFKQRKIPTVRRMNLSTYQKPFGNWQSDAAGMIVKVAEAQALRDSFPTLLGGMQLREEIINIDSRVEAAAHRPEFARGLPAPDLNAEKPTRRTPAQTQSQAHAKPEPSQPVQPPEPTPDDPTSPAAPVPLEPSDEAAEAEAGLAPQPAEEAPPEQPAQGQDVDPALLPNDSDTTEIRQIKSMLLRDGGTFAQFKAWGVTKKFLKPEFTDLSELRAAYQKNLADPTTWPQRFEEIKKLPKA